MKTQAIILGGVHATHMQFVRDRPVDVITISDFDKQVLEELKTTLDLIANDCGRIIRTNDGVRLGDYQSNFKVNFKSESK